MEENRKVPASKPEELNEEQLDDVTGGSRYVMFYESDKPCAICKSKRKYKSGIGWYCPTCNPENA